MPLVALIPEPNKPVEVREVPEPALEPDSALLEVELSEVCGTDVYLQQGRLAGVPYPLIPGHVSVGRLQKSCWTSMAGRSAKANVSRFSTFIARATLAGTVSSPRPERGARIARFMELPTVLTMDSAAVGPRMYISSPVRDASG